MSCLSAADPGMSTHTIKVASNVSCSKEDIGKTL